MDAKTSMMLWRLARAVVACGCVVLVGSGCTPKTQTPERPPVTVVVPPPVTPPPPAPKPPEIRKPECQQIEIGRSVGGKPIMAEIYGEGDATVLVIATIHGNESVGTPLVRKLGQYLLDNPEAAAGHRVIIVPIANPDGMAANTRTNTRGVDLNRNFPAWNYSATRNHGVQPLSEPESRALHGLLLKYPPKRIISIHQPLGCIDYDGPADGVARAMASSSRLPLKKLGSLAGSLGSFAGVTLKTPIITVEFTRSADNLSAAAMWERYGRMLLVGICYPDSVPIVARNEGSATNTTAQSDTQLAAEIPFHGLGN